MHKKTGSAAFFNYAPQMIEYALWAHPLYDTRIKHLTFKWKKKSSSFYNPDKNMSFEHSSLMMPEFIFNIT